MVRLMTQDDLDQVVQIERECFSDCWSKNMLRAGLDQSYDYVWVCEQQDKVQGYLSLRIIAGEGELNRIAVGINGRKQGLARELMDQMVRFSVASGLTQIMLEVREGNMAARRLYQSYGFEELTVRRFYYCHPEEHAVIMRLKFYTAIPT